MAASGGTPSLMRENCLRSELANIRRIEKVLVEALEDAGVIPPAPKEIKRK